MTSWKPGDIYSKRGKALPDVYQYEMVPEALRIQVAHLMYEALSVTFGSSDLRRHRQGTNVWDEIERRLRKEHAKLALAQGQDARTRCVAYFQLTHTQHALDVIETVFNVIDSEARTSLFRGLDNLVTPDAAIEELNLRFREHACGFQYASGQIIRVDSQVMHEEAVRPALALLHEPGFAGPNKEFLEAHKAFREGRFEDAVRGASNAFESTLKAICVARGRSEAVGQTFGAVLNTVLTLGVVPKYLKSHLEAVYALGNNEGRHGKGPEAREIPQRVAALAIHLAASYIVFAVESHNSIASS